MTALIKNTKIEAFAKTRLQPGFFDMESGKIYISCYLNGKLAPIHIQEGLPESVLERMDINVVAGFIYNAKFYTRKEALRFANSN